MENEALGYPVEVFFVTALIGVVLIFLRPRWAFLFSVFCLACRHYHLAVFTRTPYLGEFLNLNDLLLWIGVGALIRIALQGKKIWIPPILLAIIAILVLGGFQSIFQYGFDHSVMQALWAGWIFPIAFTVAANLVRNPQEARVFYWALFLGSLGAALQHLVFLQARVTAMEMLMGVAALRTISFIMSGGIFLVISAFFIDMRLFLQKKVLLAFWIISLALIGVSYLLSFTRTVWVGAFMAGLALFFVMVREWRTFLSRFGYSLAFFVIMLVVFYGINTLLLSHVDLAAPIEERAEFIRYGDTFEEAFKTRESGMETELKLWKDSPVIWGIGSSYSPTLLDSSIDERGALGHVAFSTYLAHFGLIGFVVYGLLLPFLTLRVARRYYDVHKSDYGGIIAVTAMALAFFDIFTLPSSNHYLASTTQVQGFIYGAIWGLSRTRPVSAVKIMQHS